MYSAKNDFNLVTKVDLGEGLGGGCAYEISDTEKYLIVNSVEGNVFKMNVNGLGDREQ